MGVPVDTEPGAQKAAVVDRAAETTQKHDRSRLCQQPWQVEQAVEQMSACQQPHQGGDSRLDDGVDGKALPPSQPDGDKAADQQSENGAEAVTADGASKEGEKRCHITARTPRR